MFWMFPNLSLKNTIVLLFTISVVSLQTTNSTKGYHHLSLAKTQLLPFIFFGWFVMALSMEESIQHLAHSECLTKYGME